MMEDVNQLFLLINKREHFITEQSNKTSNAFFVEK